jgi:hypothetical protein
MEQGSDHRNPGIGLEQKANFAQSLFTTANNNDLSPF